jgi:hypothetical protein
LLDISSALCHVGSQQPDLTGTANDESEVTMSENFETQGGNPGEEIVIDDTIDLEDYAKRNERPPLAKGYRIRVNGEAYVIQKPNPTGREILTVAGLIPPEEFTLRVKLAGEKPKKVGLDEVVDLRRAGVEKFKALPRDQTEG